MAPLPPPDDGLLDTVGDAGYLAQRKDPVLPVAICRLATVSISCRVAAVPRLYHIDQTVVVTQGGQGSGEMVAKALATSWELSPTARAPVWFTSIRTLRCGSPEVRLISRVSGFFATVLASSSAISRTFASSGPLTRYTGHP